MARWNPTSGHRFDAAVALIDPYARALSRQLPLRSRVIDHAFDWGERSAAGPSLARYRHL